MFDQWPLQRLPFAARNQLTMNLRSDPPQRSPMSRPARIGRGEKRTPSEDDRRVQLELIERILALHRERYGLWARIRRLIACVLRCGNEQ
jgi:hypothetical protein